jgi:hypothetical protein
VDENPFPDVLRYMEEVLERSLNVEVVLNVEEE